MNLTFEAGIPVFTVFIQGVLSFLSPCVFPLVPLYIGYLAGGTLNVDEQGRMVYPKKKVFLHTVCFVFGIGAAFYVLGLGFSVLGQFLKDNRIWFARLSGGIMILLGAYQLGIFGRSKTLEREHRLNIRWDKWTMNPITALILGFTFSFAWTPCVGPTLSAVLLMAGSSTTMKQGFVLISVYVLGFVVPFLLVGIFTGTLLTFFRNHGSIVKYTVKIGAVLLIVMGVMTLTGWLNGVMGHLASSFESKNSTTEETRQTSDSEEMQNDEEDEEVHKQIKAPDFILMDQYGKEHTLSDYRGKTIFLNFWATWCGPCKSEMPDIQKLYEQYNENTEDVIVLGVANPKTKGHPNNNDISKEEIAGFMNENGWTYPILFDESGEILSNYGITAFPTTFMIDVNGNVYGYVSGALTGDMMESIVLQTIESADQIGKRRGEDNE